MAGIVWQENVDAGATLYNASEKVHKKRPEDTAHTPTLLVCPSYIT